MTQGRSVSRKRSIRGKSNLGVILRQPCRYYLKGICTRSPCTYWHPPLCQFYKTGSGCKAGDECLFPHHKVDEQPPKKKKKSYHSQEGRESDDKNAVAIVKIVPQLSCVSQDSESLDSQRGGQSRGNRCKKSWDQLHEYDSPSLRCVKQVSRKIKDHRLEKYQSKFLISEVPTL